MASGWRCRRKSGKGRRRGGFGRSARARGGGGGWFEETEERGAHQNRHLHGDGTLSVGTHRRWLGTVVGGGRLHVRRTSWCRGHARGGAGRVGPRPEAAATGRTSVADGGTSATTRYAAAGLSDELRSRQRDAVRTSSGKLCSGELPRCAGEVEQEGWHPGRKEGGQSWGQQRLL
jgi:hypothetical protein